MSEQGIAIVGSGHAGLSIAETLRRKGYEGRVTLIGAEPGLPYQRPPLSKQYLKGEWDESRVIQRNAEFYSKHAIELISDCRVASIDVDRYCLTLSTGDILDWDRLALTTGARLRQLDLPGSDAEGVYYLQTLEQARALRAALPGAKQVIVIGGGYIGLEGAAACAMAGKAVTLLNRARTILTRSASTPVAHCLQRLHSAHDVEIENGVEITSIQTRGDRVCGVELKDGRTLPADLVLVGIGVEPATRLAQESGIQCRDGILVDEQCRTSHPDIVAAGDCVRFVHPLFRRSIRLESIQNALEQGKHAAGTLLGGDERYQAVPWFWSDQYDAKLQIAGLTDGHDLEVIRGDEQGERFSVFCYSGRRLVAVESINSPADHMISRRLIQSGVSPTPDDAANPAFSLRDLLQAG